MTRIACCFILAVLLAAPLGEAANFVVGVKIYDHTGPHTALFARWKEMGVNTAFIGTALASRPEFMDLARRNGVSTFLIFPVFYNAERLKADPGLWAINAAGKRAEKDWVRFICPSRAEYRAEMISNLDRILKQANPDGLSIDFIRYFAFWETVPPEVGPDPKEDTCYCPVCLERFQHEAKIAIPPALSSTQQKAEWIRAHHRREWVDYKCGVITSTVREIAAAARKVNPQIRLNLHLVPWRTEDFDQAERRVVGQDIAALARLVDYLSPMCYAHMERRDAKWIAAVTADVARSGGKPVLPSVQVGAAYRPEKVSTAEFRQYIEEARRTPSSGVVFWNWDALEKEPAKAELVKSFFGK